MTALIAALGSVEIDWVGTSLGGLIGMVLAALPGSPVRRIVINDIGPICRGLDCFALAPISTRLQRTSKRSGQQNYIFGAFWLRSENWKTSIGVIWRFTAWNGSQSGSATSHCVIPVLRTHSGILGTIA